MLGLRSLESAFVFKGEDVLDSGLAGYGINSFTCLTRGPYVISILHFGAGNSCRSHAPVLDGRGVSKCLGATSDGIFPTKLGRQA